ncbi:hypothetical protein FRZ03_20605 [Streptomyces misionensis]|uniref:Secreted protein n=1 Tax=Streptomyces misionensis TaxID=67331 RepID=A0A5C6JKJ8_9ACTN|nr:hypothetical protein [Streptomyces misionensis]TWV41884.1 hypothetical protein FRZ03_20605 [Streptomyces misionensis]
MKRQIAALTALVGALVCAAPGASASEPDRWVAAGTSYTDTLGGGQGLASRADGSLLHRGLLDIPPALRVEGWNHVGDPDIARGHVFDAYQGADTATSKMFAVTAPDGKRYDYVHPLDPGEKVNNSFAAVSPDGQWLVSGEWGDQDRLQVFPAPLLNPATPRTGGTLAQAGRIGLDKPVRDIQGCDFVNATRLVCASDDASGRLFPQSRPLLQVDLPHPLDGKPVTGRVSSLFGLPQRSVCTGTFEAEGVDYDPASGTLRAEVVQPGVCAVATTVYAYRLG